MIWPTSDNDAKGSKLTRASLLAVDGNLEWGGITDALLDMFKRAEFRYVLEGGERVHTRELVWDRKEAIRSKKIEYRYSDVPFMHQKEQ